MGFRGVLHPESARVQGVGFEVRVLRSGLGCRVSDSDGCLDEDEVELAQLSLSNPIVQASPTSLVWGLPGRV